jgi:hypothetical protein
VPGAGCRVPGAGCRVPGAVPLRSLPSLSRLPCRIPAVAPSLSLRHSCAFLVTMGTCYAPSLPAPSLLPGGACCRAAVSLRHFLPLLPSGGIVARCRARAAVPASGALPCPCRPCCRLVTRAAVGGAFVPAAVSLPLRRLLVLVLVAPSLRRAAVGPCHVTCCRPCPPLIPRTGVNFFMRHPDNFFMRRPGEGPAAFFM